MREANPERQDTLDLVVVETEIVSEEVISEMTPTLLPESIHLVWASEITIELFVDQLKVVEEHRKGMKPLGKYKKRDLPTKICERCGRPMVWRARWRRNWEAIKFCSERCRRTKTAITS